MIPTGGKVYADHGRVPAVAIGSEQTMASSCWIRHVKLFTGVLVALVATAILLPAESAITYALKGLVFIGCAVALVRHSSATRLPKRKSL